MNTTLEKLKFLSYMKDFEIPCELYNSLESQYLKTGDIESCKKYAKIAEYLGPEECEELIRILRDEELILSQSNANP